MNSSLELIPLEGMGTCFLYPLISQSLAMGCSLPWPWCGSWLAPRRDGSLMAESNFSEKGAFVSYYQPTLPVAGGWLHQLNKWDLSGGSGGLHEMAVSCGSSFSLKTKTWCFCPDLLMWLLRGERASWKPWLMVLLIKNSYEQWHWRYSLWTFLESSCLERCVSDVLVYWFKCYIVLKEDSLNS